MFYLAVIEDEEENIRSALSDYLHKEEVEIISNTQKTAREFPVADLVILTEKGAEKADKNIYCHIMLSPGKVENDRIKADIAVSYGLSIKDTITLSSIGDEECVVALQRELVTVRGEIIEQQEIRAKRDKKTTPEELMALVGGLLLLGVPVENLV